MLRLLHAAAFAVWATAAPAFDDDAREGVLDAVADFEAAFAAGDWPAILPPDRVFETLADITGHDADAIKAQTLAQIDETMGAVEIVSYRIRTDQMEPGTAPAGPFYAMIPTELVLSVDNGPIQTVEGLVLAAELDTGWHLFRVESLQHWMLFLTTYPEFEGIDPPQ
jgi:hypothetical protein